MWQHPQGSKIRFLTPEEEYDIELTDLGYIQPARPSGKLHGNRNTLSNADQLTRHDLCRCHRSTQTGLGGPRSVEYYDTITFRFSQLRCSCDAAVPASEPSPAQPHASNAVNNNCVTFNTPSAPSSKHIETTVRSPRAASNRRSRTFD